MSEHWTPPRRLSMSGPLRKMVTGISLFFTVCVVAVVGYMASGWKLDDSIYMVIITIFGVGYGEVQPVQSPALRALTIAVIIGGYGAVIYTVGGFMQMVVDGELSKALGARRMTKEIGLLRDHTIICGYGRMGTILCQELDTLGKSFVVIDSEERRLHEAEQRGYLVLEGDATEEFILEQAGIQNASVLATVLSQDASNVFVTITAREMNPQLMVIARGENPSTENKLKGCGASKVVLPTAIGAKKLAQLIVRPSAENMLEQFTSQGDMNEDLKRIGLQIDELKVAENSSLANKSLNNIELHSNHGFLIVGIRRVDNTLILNPPADTELHADDVVIVIGHDDDIPQLAAKLSSKINRITYRGSTIEVE